MMGKAEVGAVVKQARGRLLMDSTRVMSSPRMIFLAKSGNADNISIGACLAFYASYLLLDVTSLSDSRPSSLAPDSIAGDSFFRSMSSGILALTTSLLLILNEISPANPYPSNSLF